MTGKYSPFLCESGDASPDSLFSLSICSRHGAVRQDSLAGDVGVGPGAEPGGEASVFLDGSETAQGEAGCWFTLSLAAWYSSIIPLGLLQTVLLGLKTHGFRVHTAQTGT